MRRLSDKAEELLEHLWIKIEEEHEQPSASLVRDTEELMQLLDEGLVEIEDRTIKLTESGRREAQRCVRRHRLAERLLYDILDGAETEIHAAGCKFEHGLHRGLEEKVCTMLGHPKTCPHGKPIPPGECCVRMEREPGRLIKTVAEMDVGEEGVVAYLHSDDVSDLRKLMTVGALPGTTLIVRQRFPGYLIQIGESQFGIDEEMARQIYVRPHQGRHRRGRRG